MITATFARNEIEPLLNVLIQQLATEGRSTERAIYSHIQKSLQSAQYERELTQSLKNLYSTIYVGFNLSDEAVILLERILQKVNNVTALMNRRPTSLH